MNDITYIPIEEKSLNDKLVNLYGPKIPGLYSAVKPLFDDPNAIKPALPLLLELNDDESYENADLRVMIFGRETNNWNDPKHFRKDFPYGTYNFNLHTSEDIIEEIMGKHVVGEEDYYGLGDLYHGYFFETRKQGKEGIPRHLQDVQISLLAFYNQGCQIIGLNIFGTMFQKSDAEVLTSVKVAVNRHQKFVK